MKRILIIGGVLILLMAICALTSSNMTDNVARTNEAQAAIEAARAAQIASAGQSASGFWLGLVAVIMTVLVAMLAFRNINPSKKPANETPQLPKTDPTQLILLTMLAQLVRGQQNQATQNTQMYLPREESQEIEQVDVDWWS